MWRGKSGFFFLVLTSLSWCRSSVKITLQNSRRTSTTVGRCVSMTSPTMHTWKESSVTFLFVRVGPNDVCVDFAWSVGYVTYRFMNAWWLLLWFNTVLSQIRDGLCQLVNYRSSWWVFRNCLIITTHMAFHFGSFFRFVLTFRFVQVFNLTMFLIGPFWSTSSHKSLVFHPVHWYAKHEFSSGTWVLYCCV